LPDDDELFNLVTDHFGQASTPAIVFDPRTQVPEARFYVQGLAQPDNYEPISIRTEDVTLERVLSIVELIYRNQLVTPAIHSKVAKLWHSSRNSRPSKTAEAKIQLYLKAGLQGAFPTCVVRDEQIMPEGRLDIEIEQADALDPATVTRHAVLELKVLRSVTQGGTTVSDSTTADWIGSGVEQAAAYRTSKHFLWCALFCFDMRTSNVGQACFDHVREIAVQLGVAVRCWYLYVSAREYQRARAATG
jgi:hypothetical protein